MKGLVGGTAALRSALVGATLAVLALPASDDGAAQQGSVSVLVSESVGVRDSPQSFPPASSGALEAVTVSDSALVAPPAAVLVAETVIVVDTMADSDSDGSIDLDDNCAYWPNPGQGMPQWPVPPGDYDCDGFTNARETYLTTDPTKHCAATSAQNDEGTPDFWPLDMNDNQFVNTVDVAFFIGKLGLDNTEAGWTPRLDLNQSPNGIINTVDVGMYIGRLGLSCSPVGP